MPDIDDIEDRESFEAWLDEAKPRRAAVVLLAHRAAMRVAPLYLGELPPLRPNNDLPTSPFLRCLLTSGLGASHWTPQLGEAARAALAAVTSYKSHIQAYGIAEASYSACAAVHGVSAASDSEKSAADGVLAAISVLETEVDQLATVSVALLDADPEDANAAATQDLAVLWGALRADCAAVAEGVPKPLPPLWPRDLSEEPAALREARTEMLQGWADAGPFWRFWHDWYAAAVEGRPMDPALLTDIALIPDDTWKQSDDKVNERIAEIYDEWTDSGRKDGRPASSPGDAVGRLPTSSLRTAIETNKPALPPTLDAIGFLIQNEIARLHGINYETDEHMEECKRLIGVFLTIHDAVARMSALIPTERETTDEDADEIKPILQVFADAASTWPRENAAGVVDGSFRLGLTGSSAAAMIYMGLPASAAVLAAGLTFGGQKLAAGAKDIASVFKPGSGDP